MKTLKIADGLSLPLEAVTERIAFLGMSGGGKTYAAMKLAEEMLEVGAQVVALDPVGPWWGLRAGANGKSGGYPINVFGGIHGDLPLTATSGALLADVLAERAVSAVLDVSDFTLGQMHKFVSDFAERFFDKKKRHPTPMHLFLEEAHNFAPQQLPPGDPGAAVMMHRIDRIVRVGRNYGIGSSLISQQPQAVSKRVLNQARTLFAFTTGGKQERKAIIDWFSDKSGDTDPDVLFDELKKLEQGVAYVASPQWLKIEKQVRIAKKKTFDSSRTPKFGEVVAKPHRLAPVDLAALKDAMADVVAEVAHKDPKALQARVHELEAQVKKLEATKTPAPKVETKTKEVYVLKEGQLKRIEALAEKLYGVTSKLTEELAVFGATIAPAIPNAHPGWVTGNAARRIMKTMPATPQATRVVTQAPVQPTRTPSPPTPPRTERPPSDGAHGEVKPAALRILEHAAAKDGLTKHQLGVRAGYRPDTGHFGNLIGALTGAGLMEKRGDQYFATDAGRALVPNARLLAPAELREKWRQILKPVEWKLLDALLAVGFDGMTKAELADATGYRADTGHFGNLLGKLTGGCLAEKRGDRYFAHDDFFDGATAA